MSAAHQKAIDREWCTECGGDWPCSVGMLATIAARDARIVELEGALADVLPYAEFLRKSMEVEAAPGFEGDDEGGSVGREYVAKMASAARVLARKEATDA